MMLIALTDSYSTVWWTWQRWQRELDYMALNGINFALAFTGQEYIWQKLFLQLGLSQDEVDNFFTGAPFLAWNRMGNIEKLFGPLSQSFIDGQLELAQRIHSRMQELGMKRIVPGFSGHLPKSIKRIYPNASLIRLSNWNSFNDSFSEIYQLDPRDPLFTEIGSRFTELYIEQFGSDHYYSVDMFNEMQPPSHDVTYLAECGKAVFSSLTHADAQATWVMQGWLFHNQQEYWQLREARALITSVGKGNMIILDLFSESYPQFDRLHGYFGAPFIWSMLHNFGGVSGMFGSLQSLNERVHETRRKYPNMIGCGVTPEGIETNDIVYDFMLESSLRDQPVADISKWIEKFVFRRYGGHNENATSAWLIYGATVFNESRGIANHGRYEVTSRPSLHLQPIIWYDVDLLEIATGLMYQAAQSPVLSSSLTFKYDYVNSMRQWLQVLFSLQYRELMGAFERRDLNSLQESVKKMMVMLNDMHRLLETDEHFRLSRWLESARLWAADQQEEPIILQSAKNQLTLWGYEGEIVDYASKQWAGLISQYYQPRWQLFFDCLVHCVRSNCTLFDEKTFNARVLEEIEKPFTTAVRAGDWSQEVSTARSAERDAISSIEEALAIANSIFDGSNVA